MLVCACVCVMRTCLRVCVCVCVCMYVDDKQNAKLPKLKQKIHGQSSLDIFVPDVEKVCCKSEASSTMRVLASARYTGVRLYT